MVKGFLNNYRSIDAHLTLLILHNITYLFVCLLFVPIRIFPSDINETFSTYNIYLKCNTVIKLFSMFIYGSRHLRNSTNNTSHTKVKNDTLLKFRKLIEPTFSVQDQTDTYEHHIKKLQLTDHTEMSNGPEQRWRSTSKFKIALPPKGARQVAGKQPRALRAAPRRPRPPFAGTAKGRSQSSIIHHLDQPVPA